MQKRLLAQARIPWGIQKTKRQQTPIKKNRHIFVGHESIHSSEDQTAMNQSVCLKIYLFSDKVKLQNEQWYNHNKENEEKRSAVTKRYTLKKLKYSGYF